MHDPGKACSDLCLARLHISIASERNRHMQCCVVCLMKPADALALHGLEQGGGDEHIAQEFIGNVSVHSIDKNVDTTLSNEQAKMWVRVWCRASSHGVYWACCMRVQQGPEHRHSHADNTFGGSE